jgi:RNA polymerase subunit RPABC4/transcription elongation factor Spt4
LEFKFIYNFYFSEVIVQTCSKCFHISPDQESLCLNCGVDLSEFSEHAISRKQLINNSRVTAIRISVGKNACPVCKLAEGVYNKENLPHIPIQGCSGPNGCECIYAPILDEIFP